LASAPAPHVDRLAVVEDGDAAALLGVGSLLDGAGAAGAQGQLAVAGGVGGTSAVSRPELRASLLPSAGLRPKLAHRQDERLRNVLLA
jgi:hypothetical protein